MSLGEIEKKYTLRLAIVTLVIFAAIPVTLYLVQQSQETRKLASGPKEPFAPYVAISSPFDGAQVTGSTNINASILNEVEVSAVEFYVDNKQKVVIARSPYVYTWDTSSDSIGEHTITVRALDSKGSVGVKSITVYKSN